MKLFLSTLVFLLAAVSQAQVLNLCQPNNENYKEFCGRMKHLRATINILDQQREMMLVNYNYMNLMGDSLVKNSERLLQISPVELADHNPVFKNLVKMGNDIKDKSSAKKSDVFVVSNQVKNSCLACHDSSNASSSSSGWNDVFKINWEKVSKDCGGSGRNPYLCKSMNGMATSYSHLLTAYISNIQEYEITSGVVAEVMRILKDLKSNNFFHFNEPFSAQTQASGEEILALAKAKDPMTFTKAFQLSKSCNQCHNDDQASQP